MIEDIIKETQERFHKAIENFKSSISGISIKANPNMFNAIRVEAYGSETPISNIANINVLDASTFSISIFDASLANATYKAIQASNIGLSCIMEGSVIRAKMPPVSEQNRQKLASLVKNGCEDSKVAIRNIRKDQNEKIAKLLKDKLISEDVSKKGKEKVQDLTDKSITQIEQMMEKKTEELMKI